MQYKIYHQITHLHHFVLCTIANLMKSWIILPDSNDSNPMCNILHLRCFSESYRSFPLKQLTNRNVSLLTNFKLDIARLAMSYELRGNVTYKIKTYEI